MNMWVLIVLFFLKKILIHEANQPATANPPGDARTHSRDEMTMYPNRSWRAAVRHVFHFQDGGPQGSEFDPYDVADL